MGKRKRFDSPGGVVQCPRCGLPLRVDPKPGSTARLLKRAKDGDGLCVHCAVHDWLRNTYPINLQLAEHGPRPLLHPHIQKMYAEIMAGGHADAAPDEICWARIVEFWELPFPHKVKPSATNPVTQQELDDVAAGKRPGLGGWAAKQCKPDPLKGKMTINSFEELNLLEPGLGDSLEKSLEEQLFRSEPPGEPASSEPPKRDDDPPPPIQRTFW